MHRFAVVADPHYHTLFPGYAIDGVTFRGRSGASLRRRDDSAASTRIFNESALALPAVLDECAALGIRTVIIPGDLTDDGQAPSMEAALAILADFRTHHGMRFFLTPGNHDVYGMSGRHHAKDFLTAQGGRVTVTSRPDAQHGVDSAIVYDPRMACQGYGPLIRQWRSLGLMRDPQDLHWESPFGSDDAPDTRVFAMTSQDGTTVHHQIDASYLVEPEPGLWILSIDVNVFEPRNGRPDNTAEDAFEDSTNAGWNALVRLKPFLLDWMADVARRATAGNKTLICFSHYPVGDVLRGTVEEERKLFGETSSAQRNPKPDTTARIAATGIGTHFSGHLHFFGSSRLDADGLSLTNIAVPSPVAFPPAYLLVTAEQGVLHAVNRVIDLAEFDAFFPFYKSEIGAASVQENDWLLARTYPDFLYRHLRELVLHRFLPRDWPSDLRDYLQGRTVDDLFALAKSNEPLALSNLEVSTTGQGIPILDFLTDWYAARSAGALAREFVPSHRFAVYARLIDAFAARRWSDPKGLQARIGVLLDMFDRSLSHQYDDPPDRSIDRTGVLCSVQEGPPERLADAGRGEPAWENQTAETDGNQCAIAKA